MLGEGREPPEAFYARPDVPPDLAEHMSAFYELSTERQMGMGLGPIPASLIRRYACDQIDLDGDDLELFYSILRRTDEAYLAIVSPPAGKSTEIPTREVPVHDGEGVRKLFTRLGARKKSASSNLKAGSRNSA